MISSAPPISHLWIFQECLPEAATDWRKNLDSVRFSFSLTKLLSEGDIRQISPNGRWFFSSQISRFGTWISILNASRDKFSTGIVSCGSKFRIYLRPVINRTGWFSGKSLRPYLTFSSLSITSTSFSAENKKGSLICNFSSNFFLEVWLETETWNGRSLGLRYLYAYHNVGNSIFFR